VKCPHQLRNLKKCTKREPRIYLQFQSLTVASGPDRYTNDPRMWQVFISGLQVTLNKNLSGPATERGVANGTRVTLAGLAYTDAAKHDALQRQLAAAAPGTTLVLEEAPDIVFVNIGNLADAPFGIPRADDGGILFPLRASASQADNALTVLQKRGEIGVLMHAFLKPFYYDLLFAVTFHKLQGMTLTRLLLDLTKPVYPPHHCFENILVACSRIREGRYLRVLPGADLNHLSGLQADPEVRAFVRGFSEIGGVWSMERAQSALAQQPKPKQRRGRGGGGAVTGRGRGGSASGSNAQ
jgi:hypothetical protein